MGGRVLLKDWMERTSALPRERSRALTARRFPQGRVHPSLTRRCHSTRRSEARTMTTNGLGNFLAAGAEVGRGGGPSPVDAILDAVRQHLGMEIAFEIGRASCRATG